MEELEIKLGGIYYSVGVDTDEGNVVSVRSVAVFDGKTYQKIEMLEAELKTFFSWYEDALNECLEEKRESEEIEYKTRIKKGE